MSGVRIHGTPYTDSYEHFIDDNYENFEPLHDDQECYAFYHIYQSIYMLWKCSIIMPESQLILHFFDDNGPVAHFSTIINTGYICTFRITSS